MLAEKVMAEKEKRIKRQACHVNRASGLGDACVRKLVYDRVAWELKDLHSVRTQARFDVGNHFEAMALRELSDAGIEVTNQQSTMNWPAFKITGHCDGVVMLEVDEVLQPAILEIKSVAPQIYDQIHSLLDFNKYPWFKKYLAQGHLYSLLKEYKYCLFYLVSLDGRLKDFLLPLDLDYAEGLLKKAEVINISVYDYERAMDDETREEALPERLNDNVKECSRCQFKTLCKPRLTFGPELDVIESDELEALCDIRERTLKSRSAFERAHNHIKERLGNRLNVICGKWSITGKKDKRGAIRRTFVNLDDKNDEFEEGG